MKYIFFLLLVFTFNTYALDTGNGDFIAPTEREGGAPLSLSEIAGYNVYINGVMDNTVSPLPSTATSFTVVLNPGNNVIVLTTIDTDGRESQFSTAVTNDIPFAPNPPSNIILTYTFTP